MKRTDRARMAMLYRQRRELREAAARTHGPRADDIHGRLRDTASQLLQLQRRTA